MDELAIFMEERDFEMDHRQRLRDFFTYTKDYARESGYSLIFERMSNKLRADTALIMGEAHVQLVWYLRKSKCEIGFLCEVALNLKPSLYEIHERYHLDSAGATNGIAALDFECQVVRRSRRAAGPSRARSSELCV